MLVLDTNVLVSGLLFPRSKLGEIVIRASSRGLLLFSDVSWSELKSVLLRSKFDRYASLEKRRNVLGQLDGVFVSITERVQVCRDQEDNMILEVALNGRADLIVSGDQDLLSMSLFGEIAILSPAAYLAMLSA